MQTIIPIARHGAIRLTTAHYYTPSGRSIQAEGIDPDIEVEQAKIESLEPVKPRREGDLRGALKNPNRKPASAEDDEKDEKKPAKDSPAEDGKEKPEKPFDYQLSRALDLIRGIAFYNVRVGN